MTQENKNVPQGFHQMLDAIAEGVEKNHQKDMALNDAKLTTDQLRSLTTTVAGRLMADTTLPPEDHEGARRYVENIFGDLDRIDNPGEKPNAFEPGSNASYNEKFRYTDKGKPIPALSHRGAEFTTEEGRINTSLLLADALHRAEATTDADATNAIPKPIGTLATAWVNRELANLYDFRINHTQGDQPGYVPPLGPQDGPADRI